MANNLHDRLLRSLKRWATRGDTPGRVAVRETARAMREAAEHVRWIEERMKKESAK